MEVSSSIIHSFYMGVNIRILYHAITINFSLLRLLLIYNNSLQDILYNCYFLYPSIRDLI